MSGSAAVKRVSAETGVLHVEWADGRTDGFASLWLRDNRPQDRDSHSGQRLTDVADLPLNPTIRSVQLRDGLVVVEWQGGEARAEFTPAWLRAHAAEYRADVSGVRRRRWLPGADLDALRDFQWADGAALASDAGVRSAWLAGLLADGIAFLRDVPRVDGGILDAMAPVGQVLETNYGLVFDVRSVPQPENLAYSDLGLGLHTDNPYREPVPGFQALHALITSPDGGESLFADGLAIAEHLRDIAPEAFLLLTRTPVPFAYRSKSAQLQADRPFIQLLCTGEVGAVHYNSRSIAPLRLGPGEVEAFYAAYRRFAGLLREARFQVRFKLRDGDCVVFDNQRTLHGRLAFSSARHARHLRGCYLTRDSVYSEAARSRRG